MAEDSALGLLSSAPALRYVTGWRQPYGPGACPWHSHPSIEIVFHPSGGGTTSLPNGAKIEFDAGSALIYPGALEHIQTVDTEGEDWCVHAAVVGEAPFALTEWVHIKALQDPHLIAEIEDLTHPPAIVDAVDQAALNHRVTALMLRLLKCRTTARSENVEEAAEGYCRKAADFIHAHYQKIGQLTDVADHVGVSYHHLRHCFTRIRGQSMSNYLTWVRLERARAMLIHSELPLKEIARACGFANERYFSTCFRKVTRASPGSYRQRMRGAGAVPKEALP